MNETVDRRGQSPRQHMEEVWRQRAHRLSQRPVPADAGQDKLPVLVLGIGQERYGVHLSDVAEVLPPLRVTPVPGAPLVFSGVINVHGQIRPTIDLRRLLGMEAVPNANPARAVLLRREGREMGLQIDSVEEIRWIGSGDLKSDRNDDSAYSSAIKGSTKDLRMLLRTEALFAELDRGVTT